MRNRRAFTLVEILVVVAIAGIVVAAGIAPLMYTIRTLAQTRSHFTAANRERAVVNRMFQDMRETAALNAPTQVRVMHAEEFSANANDLLMLWTTTPAYASNAMGSVVYGMPQETVMTDDVEPGLYRWVLSKDIQPNAITPEEDLKQEAARLILPDLKGVSFYVLNDSEWTGSYAGPLPKALRVVLQYEEEERTYEAWMPNL